MDQGRMDQISRSLAAGNSRRRILRLLGVGGASGLLAVVGQGAQAGKRPHEHLQARSKRRNRKQRNKNQENQDNNQKSNNNNNQNDNTNNNGGGGLGGFFGLGTSVAYSHQNSLIYYIRVYGVNGNVDFVFGPSDPTTILSVTEPDGNDESAVTLVIDWPGWTDKLYFQAANYPFGDPSADYDKAQNVLNADGSNPHASRAIVRSTTMSFHSLDVGDSYQLDWEDGKSFKVERQSDSSDYKMFLVTALADAGA
ncbi:MAG: hypothetical protein M3Z20_08825 [Chloroflexota bacterium]|nr:hypothetical protein [Chloroflexota bacterium]